MYPRRRPLLNSAVGASFALVAIGLFGAGCAEDDDFVDEDGDGIDDREMTCAETANVKNEINGANGEPLCLPDGHVRDMFKSEAECKAAVAPADHEKCEAVDTYKERDSDRVYVPYYGLGYWWGPMYSVATPYPYVTQPASGFVQRTQPATYSNVGAKAATYTGTAKPAVAVGTVTGSNKGTASVKATTGKGGFGGSSSSSS